MLTSGLVSVTFRKLSVAQIIALVVEAQLDGIEWGGDVHAPHGDRATAAAVGKATRDAGLAVTAYGSYYRVGHAETGPFEEVLATATALGAPMIRVWAGQQGPEASDEAYWERVIADSRRIAGLAEEAGVLVVYEFHRNTLTETNDSARKLLAAVDHSNLKSYWQPPRGSSLAYNLAGIDAVAPWLVGLHLFSWHEESGERLPLADREAQWQRYLEQAASLNRPMVALLEFVRDDDVVAFRQDAATLRGWQGAER